MGAVSKVEWTDSTVNFWWGCTKVGPGCDHCYAETFDKRTGGSHWGVDVARRKVKSAVSLMHRLDNGAADWGAEYELGLLPPECGRRRRVFVQSMADLFDLEVPLDWFCEAWETIEDARGLDVQIITKRVSAVEKRLAAIGRTTWPAHAGLIITVCNQAEADRDVPRLLALKAKLGIPWVGLSIEPMLGAIDLTRIDFGAEWLDALAGYRSMKEWADDIFDAGPRLDWVICGGESGPHARPMHPDWARSLRDQCAAAGVPFFFKQWGEWIDERLATAQHCAPGPEMFDRFGSPKGPKWRPYDAADRNGGALIRLGKARAGRILDGRTHDDLPEARR